jgi:phage shock protein PspC (stress-responsive transcriptional regulator)
MENNEQSTASATEAPIAVRRLVRRVDRKVVAGVAGGIADYTALDPAIFRILFVILSLTGGVGILLYLVAWLMVPRATEAASAGERFVRRFRFPSWLGIVLLVVAAVVLASEVGFWTPAALWAVALIAIGVVLLREDPPKPATVQVEGSTAQPATGDFPPPAATERIEPRPRRPRSPLGLFTVAAAMLAVGGAAILDNLGSLQLNIGRYFALTLVVLGVGLLIGSRWGRARLMILLGVLLIPCVMATSLIHMPFRGAIGDQRFYPHSPDHLSEGYRMSLGRMVIDLSDVPFEQGTTTIPVTLAAGELDILVPRGVHVDFTGTTDVGQLWAFGKTREGTDLRIEDSFGQADSVKDVALDVQAGVGTVSVQWNDYYYGRDARRATRDEARGQGRKDKNPKREERDVKSAKERRRNR